MSKEKHWSKAEVEKLRQLLEAKTPLEVTTAQLNRTVDAVKKCKRFGLEVVVTPPLLQQLLIIFQTNCRVSERLNCLSYGKKALETLMFWLRSLGESL